MNSQEIQVGDQVQIINGPGAGHLGHVLEVEFSNEKTGEDYPNPYMVQSAAFAGVFYERAELRKIE